MKRFKVGDKVTIKEYEGEHMSLTYQDHLSNGGPNGVISNGYEDCGHGECSYGVRFPNTGKWYVLAEDVIARKVKTKARGH